MENVKFQGLVLEHMAGLTQDITEVKHHVVKLERNVTDVNNRVVKLETVIENDVAQKFGALFDGQIQIIEQLKRIEEKVDQHHEIIIKRVK